ncbi:uncharacterized protein [Mytilus edulis]|uniref:uncharacterized protein isoform X1 n=1 Tax=Mytilus edulis TaxID=6550 RepID=UPI0039EFF9E7
MRSLLHYYLFFAGFIEQFYQYQTTVVKLEVLFTLDIHNKTASIGIYNDTHASQQIQTKLLDRFLNGSCILDMKYKPDIRNETVVLKVTRFVDIPCSPSNNSGTDIVTEGLGQIHNALSHLDTNHILKSVINGTFHIFCGAEMINNCADVRKCEKHKQYEHVKCMKRGVAGFIEQFYKYQTTVVKLEVLFTLDIHNKTASIGIYNDTHAGRQIQTKLLDRFLNGSCILDMKYKPDIRNETVVLKVTRFVDIRCSPSNNSGTDIVTEGLGQIHNALSHLDTNHILKSVINGTFHIFCGAEMINNCADVKKCEKHKQYEHVKCMERGETTASYSSEAVTIGSVVGSHRTDAALSGNTGSYSSEAVTIGSLVGKDTALSGNTGSHSSESVTIGSMVGTEQLSGLSSANRETESDSSKAVTIGAVVGTVAALSGLVAAATFLRRKCKKNASVSDDTSDISSNVSSDQDDKLFFPRMFETNVASSRPPQKTAV